MPMDEKVILQTARAITDPTARAAFLDVACGGDARLRARIESRLRADEAPDGTKPGAAETVVGITVAEDREDGEPDLSFLQASSKPGSIGRLGHYEILQILGQGAFGIVFKAFDDKLHRHVAVKVMNPQLAATSPPRKRFLREARSVAAIRHENIVQVYAVEEQPLPYLVMEFIDGSTLRDKLDGTGPLEVPEILHLGRQMAAGLAAAHETGTIHRDIKPGNIMLEAGAEQKVKIADFGLARAADDASMTRTGTIAGTPMYMAPEQALGQTLDHRADLFSLGSVLYQMTCGRAPFRGPNTIAVLRRVVDENPRSIQDILPEVPDWLCTIIAKLHAKKPADRYQTAREVADLLARCQAELQLNGRVTCVTPPPAPTPPTPPAAPPAAPRRATPAESREQLPKIQVTPVVRPGTKSSMPRRTQRRQQTSQKFPIRRLSPRMLAALCLGCVGLGITAWVASPRSATQTAPDNPNRQLPAETDAVASADTAATPEPTPPKPTPDTPTPSPDPATTSPATATAAAPAPQPRSIDFEAERRAAEKLLSLVEGKAIHVHISRPDGTHIDIGALGIGSQLPAEPFYVLAVFHAGKLTDGDLEWIGNCTNLEQLGLSDQDQLTDRGFKALSRLQHLRQLHLPATRISDESVAALLKANPGLEDVNFFNCSLTAAGLSALQHCPRLRRIRLQQAGWESICPLLVTHCRELRAIHVLEPHPVNPSDLVTLPRLRELTISGAALMDGRYEANLAALLQLPFLDTLLVDPPMNDELLAKLKPLAGKLRTLHITSLYDWDPGVTAHGWQVLETFRNLETLVIGGVKSVVDGSTLRSIASLPNLRELHIWGGPPETHQYSAADVLALRQQRPDLALNLQVENVWQNYPRLDAWPVADDGSPAQWNLPPAAPPPAVSPFPADKALEHQAAWAKFLGQDVEFTNAAGMKFRLIPPGEAVGPLRSGGVQLSRVATPYYLATTEVTVAQFKNFVAATGYITDAERLKNGRNMNFTADPGASWKTPGYPLADELPVNVVSPADAAAFCDWLNTAEGGVARYRLPSKTEWLHAHYAGSQPDGFAVPGENILDYAWTSETTTGKATPVQPVATKRANPFGLHDTLGNVWEWTTDNSRGVVDGVHGGSFFDHPILNQYFSGTVHVQPNVGFRVLRQLEPIVPDQPILIARNQPTGPQATVTRPTPIPGIRSWSVELAQHQNGQLSTAWSPSGDLIATACLDMSIRLWDRAGNLRAILQGQHYHDFNEQFVGFSPDGTKLASVDRSTDWEHPSSLRIWDVSRLIDASAGASVRLLAHRPTSGSWNWVVAWSPDGKRIACGQWGGATIVDLETGSSQNIDMGGNLNHLAWAPDGRSILAGTANETLPTIYDASTGQRQPPLDTPKDLDDSRHPEGCPVAWSPDGRWIAAARNTPRGASIHLWDATTRHFVRSLPVDLSLILKIMWHPDSQRLAVQGGEGGGASRAILDSRSGEVLLAGPSGYGGLAWSPDGTEFVVYENFGLQFHDAKTGAILRRSRSQFLGVAGDVRTHLSPNGSRVWVQTPAERLEFDAESGKILERRSAPTGGEYILTAAPDLGWRALNQGDSGAIIEFARDGQQPVSLQTPGFSSLWRSDPSGERIAEAFDRQVLIWAVATGQLLATLEHPAKLFSSEWSPDGRQVATLSEDKRIRIWDANAGRLTAEYSQFPQEINFFRADQCLLAWTPDSRSLWIPLGIHIGQLDLATGRVSSVENFSNGNLVASLSLAADGDRLLVVEGYDWTFLRDRDGGRVLLGQRLGRQPLWHPDSVRFIGKDDLSKQLRGYNVNHRQRLGWLWPSVSVGQNDWSGWVCVGPTGHYRGSDGIEQHLYYVAQLDDGSWITLPPAEFATRFGWKNDPDQATLLRNAP